MDDRLDDSDSLDTPGLMETAHIIGKIIIGLALAPLIAGPMLIYGVVRGLNDKDDPRYAGRPPNGP
jgi:hypothetical protein